MWEVISGLPEIICRAIVYFKNRRKLKYTNEMNRDKGFIFKPNSLPSNQIDLHDEKTKHMSRAFLAHTFHASSPLSHPDSPGSGRAIKFSDKDNEANKIARKFHQSAGKYKRIIKGKTKEGEIADTENFLYEQIQSNNTKHIMISGEIGCGKSMLISSVVFKIMDAFLQGTQKSVRRTIPVIANVGEMLEDKTMDIIADGQKAAEKFINENLAQQVKNQSGIFKASHSWSKLFDEARSKNIKLAIFFDDTDILYEHVNKQIYSPDNANIKAACYSYYSFLSHLIRILVLNNDYHNDNIVYIFACRQETEHMLKDDSNVHRRGGEALKDRFASTIKLNKLENVEAVMDIIKKRFLLANNQIIESNNTLIPYELPDDSNIKNVLFMLHEISPQGMRRTISFLCQNIYFFYCCPNSNARLFGITKDIILLSYLGLHKKFSQANCQFINIFLVNSDYRREENNKPDKYYPEDLICRHFHTYWLKYFVLLYIHKESPPIGDQNERQHLLTGEIKSVFANTDSSIEKRNRKYNNHLVDLVLLSLSETEHGRLIRPFFNGFKDNNPNFEGVHSTKRAKYFIENDLFWSFEYLSLIVEDSWLEFPRIDEIKAIFQSPCNYDYLKEKDINIYNEKNIQTFLVRSKKVLWFLDILEITFALEQKRYEAVYTEVLNDDNRPQFKKYRNNIKNKINEFKEAMKTKMTDEQLSALDNLRKHNMPLNLKKKISKHISEMYYVKKKKLIDEKIPQ